MINSLSSLNSLNKLNTYMSSLYGARKSSFSYNNAAQTIMDQTAVNTVKFAQQNVANMKDLKNAASSLSRAASMLGAQTLECSNPEVVTSSSKFYSQAKGTGYDIHVSAMAQEQIAQSEEMSSSAKSGAFGVGYNSLHIVSGGKSTTVRFYVSEGDTNSDVLSSIAKSINSAHLGVSASVSQSGSKSKLTVSSDATGLANGFNISFDSGDFTMANIQDAQNAEYTLNGKSYTSESNEVSLPYGAGTMTIQGTGEATLERAVDTENLVSAAADFVDAYNTAVSWLSSKTGSGAGVSKALNMISNAGLSRLSSVGITMDSSGKLSLDGEKLAKAAQSNPSSVKSMLSVSERVSSGAGSAMRIPAATYTDFSSMRVSNSLIDMLMPSTGSLFDFRI